MAKSAAAQLTGLFKNIAKFRKASISKQVMSELAEFTKRIVVKRTRLGYGVAERLGKKERLKSLAASYIDKRKKSKDLDDTTSARKSNLTFTGQMLLSVQVIKAKDGQFSLSPIGTRKDGKTNINIAKFNQANGRTFMNVSDLEYKQMLRFYRQTYGDLLKKFKLIG